MQYRILNSLSQSFRIAQCVLHCCCVTTPRFTGCLEDTVYSTSLLSSVMFKTASLSFKQKLFVHLHHHLTGITFGRHITRLVFLAFNQYLFGSAQKGQVKEINIPLM